MMIITAVRTCFNNYIFKIDSLVLKVGYLFKTVFRLLTLSYTGEAFAATLSILCQQTEVR